MYSDYSVDSLKQQVQHTYSVLGPVLRAGNFTKSLANAVCLLVCL